MEREVSLPQTQQDTYGSYPEPVEYELSEKFQIVIWVVMRAACSSEKLLPTYMTISYRKADHKF
jgi:hypothetical protein